MPFQDFKEDVNKGGLNTNSRESSSFPLIVNYAGKLTINRKFLTHNTAGRLDYYLLYVTDGKLSVKLDGKIEIMRAGDFIIFPPKYKYCYGIDENGYISYFFVHFTGSHVKAYLDALKISENPKVRHARCGEEISLALSSFFIDYENGTDIKDVTLSVELSKILVLLSKEFQFGSETRSVSKSLSYINENYTREIQIPFLASLEGLSVSRYNFIFKECVGNSPVKYITNLRMRQACALLDSTNLSVKLIGEMVGYADNHFFSKHFKAYVGVSPAAYRKRAATT